MTLRAACLWVAALASAPQNGAAQGRPDTAALRVLQPTVVGQQLRTPHYRDPCSSEAIAALADSLEHISAPTELRAALARGDSSFLGVCGWGCRAVGLDSGDSTVTAGVESHGIRAFSCISNDRIILGGPWDRLRAVARTYGTRYNRLLARLLNLPAPADSAPGP